MSRDNTSNTSNTNNISFCHGPSPLAILTDLGFDVKTFPFDLLMDCDYRAGYCYFKGDRLYYKSRPFGCDSRSSKCVKIKFPPGVISWKRLQCHLYIMFKNYTIDVRDINGHIQVQVLDRDPNALENYFINGYEVEIHPEEIRIGPESKPKNTIMRYQERVLNIVQYNPNIRDFLLVGGDFSLNYVTAGLELSRLELPFGVKNVHVLSGNFAGRETIFFLTEDSKLKVSLFLNKNGVGDSRLIDNGTKYIPIRENIVITEPMDVKGCENLQINKFSINPYLLGMVVIDNSDNVYHSKTVCRPNTRNGVNVFDHPEEIADLFKEFKHVGLANDLLVCDGLHPYPIEFYLGHHGKIFELKGEYPESYLSKIIDRNAYFSKEQQCLNPDFDSDTDSDLD